MNEEFPRFTNEHLANERTFLAWVRTAIAIMAFGFVVVKFSIFVRQISTVVAKKDLAPPANHYSGYMGIILVAMGGAVLILSYIQFKRVKKQIEKNTYNSSSNLTSLLTLFIFIGCLALIGYLFQSI